MKSQTHTKQKQSACGCGGKSGTGSSGSCSCKMPSCGGCADQGFVRPRFFAGQLLTEDDLEALGNYVVAKSRLHNRMFFGDDVVCGLNVSCHPCGDGTVVVKPGYALDCCGNDVVVSCEQTLDVLGLLRELQRERLGGYDCTDPCKESPAPAPPPAAEHAERSAQPVGAMRPEETRASVRREQYCLYIRYCEETSELLSPFADGGACGASECEPSRVKEGFRFELRCAAEQPKTDMLSAIFDCLGDILKLDRGSADAALLQRESKHLYEAATSQAKIEFTREHAQRMRELMSPLEALGGTRKRDAEAVLDDAAVVAEGGSLLARLEIVQRPDVDDQTTKEISVFQKRVYAASGALASRIEAAGSALTPLETAYAEAAVEMASSPRGRLSPYSELWARGGTYSKNYEVQAIAGLEALQRALLDSMKPGRATADCALRADIAALRMPLPGQADVRGAAREIARAGASFAGALLRILLDCVCLALTPPCNPCDDPGVLLACLDIEECKVTGICNTSRKLVPTSNAIRYWLPPLGWLGEVLELACCTLRKGITDGKSFRALSAWLGSEGRDGFELDMNLAQLGYALNGYYGSAAPGERELSRLPKVLEQIFRTAMHRSDVTWRKRRVDPVSPPPPAPPHAEPAAAAPATAMPAPAAPAPHATPEERIALAELNVKALETAAKQLRKELQELRKRADG